MECNVNLNKNEFYNSIQFEGNNNSGYLHVQYRKVTQNKQKMILESIVQFVTKEYTKKCSIGFIQ